MRKAYTRAGVVTGGFLLSQSQGLKILAWNLFYKQNREVYNVKSDKKRFNFIVIFHADPENFLAEITKLFPSNHQLKRADYEYDFAHDRSS